MLRSLTAASYGSYKTTVIVTVTRKNGTKDTRKDWASILCRISISFLFFKRMAKGDAFMTVVFFSSLE